MSEILDLESFRHLRSRALLDRQLRDSLRALPPVPNAGLHCGDFVRLGDGSIGWIREQTMVGGKLMLTVSAGGRAVRVMAENVIPVSGA